MFNYSQDFMYDFIHDFELWQEINVASKKNVWTFEPRGDKFTPEQRHKIQSLRDNAEDVEFEEIKSNKI